MIGGVLLVILGLSAGFYAISELQLGTFRRMGTGMFPTVLAILLVALGLVISVPAFFRAGTLPSVDWRPLIFVSVGICAFALAIGRVGLVPAIIVLTLIAAFAERKPNFLRTGILAIALSAVAYLVFVYLLGIYIQPFGWRF